MLCSIQMQPSRLAPRAGVSFSCGPLFPSTHLQPGKLLKLTGEASFCHAAMHWEGSLLPSEVSDLERRDRATIDLEQNFRLHSRRARLTSLESPVGVGSRRVK